METQAEAWLMKCLPLTRLSKWHTRRPPPVLQITWRSWWTWLSSWVQISELGIQQSFNKLRSCRCTLHCTIHCIISASLITADGAYHCPVGSIWPFFIFWLIASFLKDEEFSKCFFHRFCGRKREKLPTFNWKEIGEFSSYSEQDEVKEIICIICTNNWPISCPRAT